MAQIQQTPSLLEQYREEKHIIEVDEESVYGVLEGFVGWLDLQGIKPKTLTRYVHATKKFLLFLDVRIDAQLFREKMEQPRILKIEDEPLPMETVRRVLAKGRSLNFGRPDGLHVHEFQKALEDSPRLFRPEESGSSRLEVDP